MRCEMVCLMLTHRASSQVHLFHITDNDTRLTWMSKDNRNRSINIKDIKNVRTCMSKSTCVSRVRHAVVAASSW